MLLSAGPVRSEREALGEQFLEQFGRDLQLCLVVSDDAHIHSGHACVCFDRELPGAYVLLRRSVG